jgi:hypothetical protein
MGATALLHPPWIWPFFIPFDCLCYFEMKKKNLPSRTDQPASNWHQEKLREGTNERKEYSVEFLHLSVDN